MIRYKMRINLILSLPLLTVILLILTFPFILFTQTDWEILYQEDFEDGVAEDWELDDPWEVVYESGNYILKGEGHNWARYESGYLWTNYSLECKVKFSGNSTLHINTRHSDNGRYFIGFNQGGIYLKKQQPWETFHDLVDHNEDFLPNVWHNFKVTCINDSIKIYMNGELKIQYKDPKFLAYGTIAFETLDESTAYVDNISVIGQPFMLPLGDTWEKILIDTSTFGANFPTVGDIEDDGDLDVLILSLIEEPLSLEILWFEAPNWTKHVIDNDGGMIKTVDFNGDGKTDIVAANHLAGEVVWYEAPSWTRHVIGTLQAAAGVDVVDLDKDEDLDVVAAAVSPNKIVWYEAPTWIVHTISDESTSPADPIFIETVDIDTDNDLDIIIGSEDGTYLFEAPAWTSHSIGDTNSNAGFAIGDIDSDGDLDVVSGDSKINMIFWYDNPTWTRDTVNVNQGDVRGIGVADLDKDNDLDVISQNHAGILAWHESPEWVMHVIDHKLREGSPLCLADMDGNSYVDIVACGSETGYVVLYKSLIFTGISSENPTIDIPQSIRLSQNYPNPFNPVTIINYQLPMSSDVELNVYSLLGQKVVTLVSEKQKAGYHQVEWNASNMASGVYLYRLEAEGYVETKKMVLMK